MSGNVVRLRSLTSMEELPTTLPSPTSSGRRAAGGDAARNWLQGGLITLCLFLLVVVFRQQRAASGSPISKQTRQLLNAGGEEGRPLGPVLVSYSYFEKDEVQLANADFFFAVGMGINSAIPPPEQTDFVVVISGELCAPCQALRPFLKEDPEYKRFPATLAGAWSVPGVALLQRTENEGMDFAAHNVTIEWVRVRREASKYRYFIFLNSSVRGPFYPSYMPPGWQWTQAYTDRLVDNIKVVSSSLVCLPAVDAGGFGPKIESWAFALDAEGLEVTTKAGVFNLRTCKLCDDGVVVMGEYGLSNTLLAAGYNLATLMSKYAPGVDWSNDKHWHCNNNAHPSRHGSYDYISMHPFETVFLKASWHVGEPHLAHYTQWFSAHAEGNANTGGTFNERMYRYAISMEAQEPNNAADCFRVI